MSVRFAIGRAGTGKTLRCFQRIVQAMREEPLGPAIYWLVPKQATFMAERDLTCTSGLGGFCRARIVSFELLGREILAECGGSAVPQVTALGRQMILGHLLRKHQPQLRFFTSVARQAGLAAKLDATFAELERCGKDASDLKTLITELEAAGTPDVDSASLLAKAHDLHLIYAAYSAYLGQERLDPHRRLNQVLSYVRTCKSLRQATVYVDGFAEFTEYERRVLAALAGVCHQMEIALLLDPDSPVVNDPTRMPAELSLFHRTELAYCRLRQALVDEAVPLEKPLLLREVGRFHNGALAGIERHLFDETRSAEGDPQHLLLLEAPDRRAEVDAAARHIRSLLQEGFRLRDVMVLTRDLTPYHELILASFREHDIPYFLDRRRTVAHHPLLQFVRSAFLIVQHNWPHEPVMALLKDGLAGLTRDEADEVENYVLMHRLRGAAWASPEPWNYCRTLLAEEADELLANAEHMEAQRIDQLRRKAVEPLRPFVRKLGSGGAIPVRQVVLELLALLEAFQVRQTLARWITAAQQAGRHEQAGEDEQVWAELVELLDQMVELLGEEQVTAAQFLEILDSGLEQFDLAITPPTVDQVLVGEVDRTRSPQLRAIILLGMNEGAFPRVAREDSVLSDGERRVLRQRRIDVDPDAARRLLDENLLGYIAFTRASERLCLSRCVADDAGRPLGPSPFWRRLRELFPQVQPRTIPRQDGASTDRISTPRQLVTALMKWVRNRADSPGDGQDGPWPSLYHWLASHDCCSDVVDLMRYRAWKALRYENVAALAPEVAEELFPSPLHASVTRIETFATCPFRHYLRYGLKLCLREQEDVTAMDLGNVYHQILEKLVRHMLHARHDWAQLEPQLTEPMIQSYAREIGQTLRGELMLSTARNQFLLHRIEKTLSQVIASQRAIAQRGRFRPAWVELGFGVQGSRLPAYRLQTPRGKQVLLYGKIDRVDMVQDQAQVAVIDYKLSGNPLSLERVYHGISLQLLTYLLVLQTHGHELTGNPLTPVAAFYMRLLRRLEDVKHPDEALNPDDPCFDLQVKPRGIFEGQYIRSLDTELTSGKSEVVQAHLKQDGQFGYRNNSDVTDSSEFASLLAHVRKRIGELGEQILAGQIAIGPYWINRRTPCPQCDYRAVCRFDMAFNQYRVLPSMKREEVLQRLTGRAEA